MTTTSAGRIQLAHPDLGTPGGASLWNAIHALYTKLGNSANFQYFSEVTKANAASEDFVHNLDMNLTDLTVLIVENDVPLTMEAQSVYGIVEKSGNEKNAITVTNNSGGSKTFAVYVMGMNIDKVLGREKARITTTDATQTTLLTVAVPSNESFLINALICAKKDDNATANAYEIKALAENSSGTASVRIISKLTDEDDTDWDATIDANSGNIRIRVTGEAGTNLEWYCVAQKTYF